MNTQSKSCITNSQPMADRIVYQLRAAGFSMEEISVLLPTEDPIGGYRPTSGSEYPGKDGVSCEGRSILVSVHLVDRCRMERAEEIFSHAQKVGVEVESDDDITSGVATGCLTDTPERA